VQSKENTTTALVRAKSSVEFRVILRE